MLLQDGEAGDHGNMLLGGNVGGILLLQGVPKEPVGNCKALTDGEVHWPLPLYLPWNQEWLVHSLDYRGQANMGSIFVIA